jgi:hypothetical protein
MTQPARFHPSAGIAIGPILFVLALLAILAAVMAAGNGDFQVAGGSDRITADIVAQTNLIRNTINECNLQYTLQVSSGSINPINSDPPGPYPSSDTSNGTAVSALVCNPTTGASLWGYILLPPPTLGFNPWTYINEGTSGGRCIWTTPSTSNPSGNIQVTSGLTLAASKFNSSTAYSATTEVIYDPSSASQKFVVWITPPTGTPDSHCLP